MDTSSLKNIVVLKDLPSNIVEEAIVVLKENKKIPKLEIADKEEKRKRVIEKELDNKKIIRENEYLNKNKADQSKVNQNKIEQIESYKEKREQTCNSKENVNQINSKDYIVKEAQMLIADYISKIENKNKKENKSLQTLKKKYKKLKAINYILATCLAMLAVICFWV